MENDISNSPVSHLPKESFLTPLLVNEQTEIKQKSVIILEDDRDISDIVAFILSSEGHKVEQCSTVKEFYKAVDQIKPDLFVLDIALPDGNGLDVCKGLKEDVQTSKIPVLIMSAHTDHIVSEEHQCDFISKPFDIWDFKKKIERYA